MFFKVFGWIVPCGHLFWVITVTFHDLKVEDKRGLTNFHICWDQKVIATQLKLFSREKSLELKHWWVLFFLAKDFESNNEFYRAGSWSKDAAKWLKVCSKGHISKLFSIGNMVNCIKRVPYFSYASMACGQIWHQCGS